MLLEATKSAAEQDGLIALEDGSRPRVLLAEDSAAARILTAALLKRMGCDVDVVEHGEEAVGLAQVSPFDLIILDIEMPVMDGVVAAREIRALGGARGRTPIVALSALLADARKLNAWKDAFDAMLAKPAGREKLRRVIASVLKRRRSGPDAAEPVSDPLLLVDLAALSEVRARIEREEWRRLLEMAVIEMRELAERMRAAEALGDRNSIRSATHKLKGIASTFAAPRLRHLAATLEGVAERTEPAELTRQVAGVERCMEATAIAFGAAVAASS